MNHSASTAKQENKPKSPKGKSKAAKGRACHFPYRSLGKTRPAKDRTSGENNNGKKCGKIQLERSIVPGVLEGACARDCNAEA